MCMSILNLIRTDDFLILNRVFIRELGLNPAILLCELANQSAHFEEEGQLETFDDEYGYFYEKIAVMEKRTGLSRREQDTALKVLKERELIKCVVKGLPAKRYFKVNEEKATEVFLNSKSRMAEKDKVDVRKSPTNTSEKRQAIYIDKEKEEENKDKMHACNACEESEKISFLNGKGKSISLPKSDIYRAALKYPLPIVEQALEDMKKVTGPVNNILSLALSICERLHSSPKISEKTSQHIKPTGISKIPKSTDKGTYVFKKEDK